MREGIILENLPILYEHFFPIMWSTSVIAELSTDGNIHFCSLVAKAAK